MSNHLEGWVIIRNSEGRDPAEMRDQLVAAGLDADLVVCVREDQAEDARRVLEGDLGEADPSPALDLETIAVFQGLDAEMQAAAVQGLLEQNGIYVVVEGAAGLPSLPFEIKVAGNLAAQAREILVQAEASGAAAVEAEASGS